MKLFTYTTSAALLFSAIPIASANADTNGPVIGQVEANKSIVAPGDSIQFTVNVTDASLIDSVMLSVKPKNRSASTKTIHLTYNESTKRYEGSYTVPTTAFNEKWYVDAAYARDVHGNVTSYYDSSISSLKWDSGVSFQIYNGVDVDAPKFAPLDDVTIPVFSAFDPLNNVTAVDDIDGEEVKITVDPTVNSAKVGSTTLTYTARDKAGNETKVNRVVNVVDTVAPIITFSPQQTFYVDEQFDFLQGVTASDNYDGDITPSVKLVQRPSIHSGTTVTVQYTVKDSSGNTTTADRPMTFIERPQTILNGINDKAIVVGASFNPLDGVTANKEEPKALASLEVTGKVNTEKIGIYPITYRYVSKTGEVLQATRNIHVVSSLAPTFKSLPNLFIEEGTQVNVTANLQAVDAMGGNVWNISSSYGGDLQQPGKYTITYELQDNAGNKATYERFITIYAKSPSFKDVPRNHTYYKQIESMKAFGIINGYPTGAFHPNESITRQHVAALIYRSGIDLTPVRPATTFKDVPLTHPYYNEIMSLYRAGIIDGSNGTFNPNAPLKRTHLAKILVNAFDLQLQNKDIPTFNDVLGTWAEPYVNILASNDITTGSNGLFLASQNVSRMHYATFMYRIFSK